MPRGIHMRGRKLSDETRRKISENNARYWAGKTHSDETKAAIAAKKQANPVRYWLGKKRVDMVGHTWNVGKTLSPETRQKLSEAITGMRRPYQSKRMRGEGNHNWKGGITPAQLKVRNSDEYKAWRQAVFQRDDWTCQNCFVRGGVLNADHIQPFALYPELRFDVNNGRTLCKPCHIQVGWKGSYTQRHATL